MEKLARLEKRWSHKEDQKLAVEMVMQFFAFFNVFLLKKYKRGGIELHSDVGNEQRNTLFRFENGIRAQLKCCDNETAFLMVCEIALNFGLNALREVLQVFMGTIAHIN